MDSCKKSYQIIIETRDGKTKTLKSTWTKEAEDDLMKYHGVDMKSEITNVVFSEIAKGLNSKNITIVDLKCIRFEEVTN